MTCRPNCDARPQYQVNYFNIEQMVTTFGWFPLFFGVDDITARYLEKCLTAVYISQNNGRLPPKHERPCFKVGDLWQDVARRLERAIDWINEQKTIYGPK